MSKRKRGRPKGSRNRKGNQMQVVNPNAAGIYIGSEVRYVAVPPDRDSQPVRVHLIALPQSSIALLTTSWDNAV